MTDAGWQIVDHDLAEPADSLTQHAVREFPTHKRILFLVDRRALAAQAVRAYSVFEPEPNQKFDKLYEVYSNKFQKEDFGEEDKFDAKIMPKEYLSDPQAKHVFVYVCTIQRMAISILGRQAVFTDEGDDIDEDAEQYL